MMVNKKPSMTDLKKKYSLLCVDSALVSDGEHQTNKIKDNSQMTYSGYILMY